MNDLLKRDRVPRVRFGLKEYRVYFNHAILILLGNPKYVQFLYEEKRKLLLIAGNNEKLPSSLIVPKSTYQHRMNEFRICHKHLTEAFMFRLGWDKDENYTVNGVLNSNLNMVVFDLACASKIESGQDVSE